MAVHVTFANVGELLPAQSVTSITATRLDGGDINVVLRLDNERDYAYRTTTRFPYVLFVLMGIDTIGRVDGPVSVDAKQTPITVTVHRGKVATVNKF